MKAKDLIELFEARMFEAIEQYIDDQTQLGGTADNVGVMMTLINSKENLKEAMLRSQLDDSEDNIDSALNTAHNNLFKRFFETDIKEKPKKFNSIFVGTIRLFKLDEDETIDNIYVINVVAGKAPSKRMMTKTEATERGFLLGKSYLINCMELEPNQYGERQFEFKPTKEMTAMEVLSAVDKLGLAEIVDV